MDEGGGSDEVGFWTSSSRGSVRSRRLLQNAALRDEDDAFEAVDVVEELDHRRRPVLRGAPGGGRRGRRGRRAGRGGRSGEGEPVLEEVVEVVAHAAVGAIHAAAWMRSSL